MRPRQPSREPELPRAGRRRPVSWRGTDVVEEITTWLVGVFGIVGVLAAFLISSDVREAWGEATPPGPVAHYAPDSPHTPRRIDRGEHAATPEPGYPPAPRDGRALQGVVQVTRFPPSGPAASHPGNQAQRLVLGGKNAVKAMTFASESVVFALTSVALALWLTWRLVTRWTAARNCQRWAHEWAQVEPVWSGRKPHRPEDRRER